MLKAKNRLLSVITVKVVGAVAWRLHGGLRGDCVASCTPTTRVSMIERGRTNSLHRDAREACSALYLMGMDHRGFCSFRLVSFE